jgi:hypothetical protein
LKSAYQIASEEFSRRSAHKPRDRDQTLGLNSANSMADFPREIQEDFRLGSPNDEGIISLS